MPKRYLLPVLEFHLLIFLIAIAVITKPPTQVLSATTHVVISEVQIQGDNGAADEFIELYNPTNSAVDISSWSIQRETTTGSFEKKNFEASNSMPAQGYFLITNSGYNGSITADMAQSTVDLANTGTTVFLVNDQTVLSTGDESTIVDKVAIGSSAVDPESTSFGTIPGDDASIERKPGVADPSGGNGADTENNANDFDLRGTSEPQNNASTAETPAPDASPSATPEVSPLASPDASPSPTPEVTPSATPEPTPVASPSPDVSPSPDPSASPTPEPSASPTPEPSASPSPETSPSPTPETSPSPTPEVSPSPTPEVTPSPTP
ncbi:MAG: lamin tail domain-containing protein, partial [Patescibacteria group bacterium]